MIVGLVITLLIGAAGAIFGSEYNVLAQLQIQPRVPVSEGALATGGLIALAAIILGTLLATGSCPTRWTPTAMRGC